eukprot:2865209-Alexandrium_andersonii.AAC.1
MCIRDRSESLCLSDVGRFAFGFTLAVADASFHHASRGHQDFHGQACGALSSSDSGHGHLFAVHFAF